MALSVLNNIPSLVAQNQLQVTNSNLQSTLFQLSSGSRINTGADDAAGLAIANGLQANISAIQQSALNANNGVGKLQVADGALSQVTTLLNRAVTLATEAASGTVSQQQRQALNAEFTSIQNEITRIGNATNFNGTAVFQAATVPNANVMDTGIAAGLSADTVLTPAQTFSIGFGTATPQTWVPGVTGGAYGYQSGTASLQSTDALAAGETFSLTNTAGTFNFTAQDLKTTGSVALASGAATALTNGSTFTFGNANGTVNFTAGAASKVSDLVNAINTGGVAGLSAYVDAGNHLIVQSTSAGGSVTASGMNASAKTDVGDMTAAAAFTPSTVNDLMTAINGSGYGFTAALDGNGNLQIGSNSAITNEATTMTEFGTMSATATVQNLINWINGNVSGVTAGLQTVSGKQQLVITDNQNRGNMAVADYDTALGGTGGGSPVDAFSSPNSTGAASTSIFISDGNVSNTYNTISVTIGALDSSHLGTASIGTDALYSATSDAASITAAQTALTDLNSAIAQVASIRGGIGAGINRLNSAVNVMNTQVQNLTSAESSIKDADVGQVVANLSKYQVLEQTGIAALAQANSQEQAVLKLLQ